MSMHEFALSPPQRQERRDERRAAYVKRTTQKLAREGKQRKRGQPGPARAEYSRREHGLRVHAMLQRRRRSRWLARWLFKASVASIAFAWVALGGADPLMARLVTSQDAALVGEAVAALEQPATEIALVDTNGDGSIDLASPTAGIVRGHDAYGSGAFGATRDKGKRKHAGCDFVAHAGDEVHAPIGGIVTRISHSYDNDRELTFVEIEDVATQLRARVHYVDAAVFVGQILTPGEAIGFVQDLSKRYPGGMTNHVHVELSSIGGMMLDPETMLPKPKVREARAEAQVLPGRS